ncbi:MAG TPA: phosphatase PAP2 family protein [Chloroflexota bacterium]|nr:phosphatase PAP2 family protein [Chloroflexota bacterium]
MSAPASRRGEVTVTSRHQGPALFVFLGLEIVLLALLAALSMIVRGHPGPLPGDVGMEVDVQHALLHKGLLTAGLEGISTLNWPTPSVITLALIIGIFLLLRRWLDAIVIPIAAAAESVSTYLLSAWDHRPRPWGYGVHPLQHITSSYSFPSGHVAYATAVFGLFLFLTFQVRRAVHPALVWAIRIVLIALIVLMPLSRIVEGEHWPSDTLGGALDGAFWLVLFAHLYLWARARWPRLLARDER